jgi:hypothetical protein
MAKRPRKAAKKRTKTAARARKRPAAKKRAPKRSAKRPTKRPAKRRAKPAKLAIPQTLRTPPSSLDMNRVATAARTGRQVQEANQRRHNKMAALTAGDVDADMESAYFTGDETPGGDNPTPDQNDVDDIGHAVGVEYGDTEELKGSDKVAERDKHRWENE